MAKTSSFPIIENTEMYPILVNLYTNTSSNKPPFLERTIQKQILSVDNTTWSLDLPNIIDETPENVKVQVYLGNAIDFLEYDERNKVFRIKDGETPKLGTFNIVVRLVSEDEPTKYYASNTEDASAKNDFGTIT